MKYVKFDIKTPIDAPEFIGSMIRGVLGGALKDVVCINPSFDCKECFAKDDCIYYKFYEEKNRFVNYRLDFNLYSKKIEFGLYLFNDAVDKYPYILSAIFKAFSQKGIGYKRETTEDFEIYYDNNIIFKAGEFSNNIKAEPKEFESSSFSPIIKLKLITPLRLKRDGRFLKSDNLDIKDILISAISKKSFFEQTQKEHIEQFPSVVMKDLAFKDFTRFSNRQKRKMKVGGVVGEMIINNLTPQTYNLLKYATITGVGKLNSFGLGKIEIEELA